jgi:UPF0271 protein
MAAADEVMATAICRAVKDIDRKRWCCTDSPEASSSKVPLPLACEPPVKYLPTGPTNPMAVLHRAASLAHSLKTDATSMAQVLQMVQQSTVTAVDGHTIPLQTETICVHSDGAHALVLCPTYSPCFKTTGY